MTRNLHDLLFSDYDLRGTLEGQERAIGKAVEECPGERLTKEALLQGLYTSNNAEWSVD